MNTGILKSVIVAAICFVIIGAALEFGPNLLSGFESMRVNSADSNEDIDGVITSGYASEQNIENSGGGNSELTIGTAGDTSLLLIAMGNGEDTADIAVAYPVYFDQVSAVNSVTSNITETPVVDGVSGRIISLSGLQVDEQRDLAVDYKYRTATEYTGLSPVLRFGPTICLLGFIIMVGVVGFLGIRMQKERTG